MLICVEGVCLDGTNGLDPKRRSITLCNKKKNSSVALNEFNKGSHRGKIFVWCACSLLDIQPVALHVRKYSHFSLENEHIPLAEKGGSGR